MSVNFIKHEQRSISRRCALQVLYQSEILGVDIEEILADESKIPEETGLDDYARLLVRGVNEHVEELDTKIIAASENWSLDRMPIIDRSLLRIAVYEMGYGEDVPVSVAINEAVELAKEFGGEDDSHRFVNGILGRIARTGEENEENDSDPA